MTTSATAAANREVITSGLGNESSVIFDSKGRTSKVVFAEEDDDHALQPTFSWHVQYSDTESGKIDVMHLQVRNLRQFSVFHAFALAHKYLNGSRETQLLAPTDAQRSAVKVLRLVSQDNPPIFSDSIKANRRYEDFREIAIIIRKLFPHLANFEFQDGANAAINIIDLYRERCFFPPVIKVIKAVAKPQHESSNHK